jgi:hypothetical protein
MKDHAPYPLATTAVTSNDWLSGIPGLRLRTTFLAKPA